MLAQIRGQRKRHTHVIGCKTPDREKKLTVIEKKNSNLQYHHELPCYNVLGECVQVFLHGFKYVVQRSLGGLDIFYLFHSCAVWL